MNQDDRVILGRIDERTESIIRELTTQNKHLAQINGKLLQHAEDIEAYGTTIYGRKSDKGLCGDVAFIRRILYGLVVIVLGGGTVAGGLELTDVIHIFGGS